MPPEGTYLAFDFGEQRIGVAVGQTITCSSNPLETVQGPQRGLDWDRITQLIKEWQPVALVVGVPLHMDGTEIPMTARAQRFSRQLEGRYQLAVFTADERYSSREAESVVKDNRQRGRKRQKTAKGDIDKIAATLILQRWFEQTNG